MKRSRITATLVAAAVILGAGCSSGGHKPAEVAAVVDSTKVSAKEIESLTNEYLRSQAARELSEQVGRAEVARLVLGFRIKNLVLIQTAKDMGVSLPADPLEAGFSVMAAEDSYRQAGFSERDLVEADRDGRLSKALAEKIFPQVPVADDEVRQTFEQQKQAFQQSWRVGADVGIFNSADAATRLRERVQGGEPFAQAAAALGAAHTGTVEVTPISPIPQPFIDALSKLRTGEISEPVAAGASWFVARVDRRDDFSARSFEEVKPEVTAFLADQKRQDLFTDWFVRKLRAAHVRVDEAYGKWDPSSGTVQG
jgi:foldase protein PrsA